MAMVFETVQGRTFERKRTAPFSPFLENSHSDK